VRLGAPSCLITIGSGGFSGSDPVALVDPSPDLAFIGKPAVKASEGFTDPLPVERFKIASGWKVDTGGILDVDALPLTAPGETAGAYLGSGSVHFYKFTPTVGTNYSVTTSPSFAAGWADGSTPLLAVNGSQFYANKSGLDVIIMLYYGTGNYTVKYNQH
jgi:hypothetical protein